MPVTKNKILDTVQAILAVGFIKSNIFSQVIDSEEDGSNIEFFKEIKADFFTKLEKKDVAFVLKEEMTTLTAKCYEWTVDGRVYGVKLQPGVKSVCLEKLGLA